MVVQLAKEKRTTEAVNALKTIEPALVNLVPLTEYSIPTVYVDIGEKTLLPTSLLGSGLSNCLHILLPSILYKNATILIDEFEDGLHHSVFKPLLAVTFELARKNNNQLFITSHSNEFLQSLISLGISSEAEDIVFFRLSRKGMQGVVPKYSLSDASSVLESNLDIR
jgi:AAA15 family ATPase/GTPase